MKFFLVYGICEDFSTAPPQKKQYFHPTKYQAMLSRHYSNQNHQILHIISQAVYLVKFCESVSGLSDY